MKALFITFLPLTEGDGISKKIKAQHKSFVKSGYDMELSYFHIDNGVKYYRIASKDTYLGSRVIAKLRSGAIYKSLYKYIEENNVKFIYVRYNLNSSANYINFLKRVKSLGVKVYLEIPTYPYDGEQAPKNLYSILSTLEERFYRKYLSGVVDRIVTFSNHDYIYGIKCINISNAIDLDAIRLREVAPHHNYTKFLAVATLSFWHGYDRMITAVSEYYKNTESRGLVYLDIAGEGPTLSDLKKQAKDLGVEKYIMFHGKVDGAELVKLFDDADICVGSLGRHRSKIYEMKALKNIEYAAYGIPFIYSEKNPDFDSMPYIYKVSSDESVIDIVEIIDTFENGNYTPANIRESVTHLSWDNQINKVIEQVKAE